MWFLKTAERLGKKAAIVVLSLGLAATVPMRLDGQLLQGTLNGNVADVSQAALVGATVVATDQATGFSRTATTDNSGFYTLPGLPPGVYNVKVSAPGFQTASHLGVGVTAQTVSRLDATLTLGSINQTITVSAQAAELQADRADVHTELAGSVLKDIPVPIGRNYQMVFSTIPGVSPPQNSHSFSANGSRSLAFTVNGGNVNANDTRIDGAGTRNYSASDVILYVPALEAIETVNVATNAFDADQSSGGGYINVTVKGGTNAVHGAVFEDHSDKSLQAYQWAANRNLPKLPFINNQFGGTIGGPILKNKLFYFGSYEGVRLVQGNAVQAQVPSAAMKTGNLSASPTSIYNPMTGNRTAQGGNRSRATSFRQPRWTRA